MGTKYVTEAISGYNSSPPTDDGSNTEANKVKWSTHKTKLNDPIKDQVANIDAKLLLMADVDPETKTSTYTTVAADHQKTMECDGTFTLTLLAVASAPDGYVVTVKNEGTGTITVDATGSETIDTTTSTISLATQEAVTVQMNQAKTGYSVINKAYGTRLDNVEASADVTDTANVTSAGALMDSEVDADIKTLVLPASTTISAFGRTLIDDAAASNALTTLGLDTDLGTISLPASTTISTFGASLIDDATAAAARTTLGVGLGTGDLVSTNNLSDVSSAATSRANLGIMHQKIIDIGDWNMDATGNVSIVHGLTLSKIRSVKALIRNDADTEYFPNGAWSSFAGSSDLRVNTINSTTVNLDRSNGGLFDNIAFDSTSYNRGWITIQYVD